MAQQIIDKVNDALGLDITIYKVREKKDNEDYYDVAFDTADLVRKDQKAVKNMLEKIADEMDLSVETDISSKGYVTLGIYPRGHFDMPYAKYGEMQKRVVLFFKKNFSSLVDKIYADGSFGDSYTVVVKSSVSKEELEEVLADHDWGSTWELKPEVNAKLAEFMRPLLASDKKVYVSVVYKNVLGKELLASF